MAEDAGSVTLEFKTTHALLIAFVVGVFAGGFLMSAVNSVTGLTGAAVQDTQNNPTQPSDTGNNPSPSENQGADTVSMDQITIEGQPTMGSSDAPVTMVIYEDFQCPFCQRFEQNTMPKIVKNYVETGKVRVVWKDFPLPQLHPWATAAAETMECVYRQDEDAFWAVKDKVFNNQNSLTTDNVQQRIKSWAAQEGVSESAVQSCLDSGNPSQAVQNDKSEASSIGVSGTPTAIVNGQKIVGAQPYSRFQSAIESALSGS
ncbi:MAG: DsbA family protein [Candidatus Nanohaloarchaea archaeon]